MMNRTTALNLLVVTVCALAACETQKSANPLSPDVAGPIPGVAITAPKTLEPVMGQQVVADGTPTVLLIENSGTSGQRELFLQVDVAADAGFQQFVHQANRVPLGPNGRTSYRMPDALGAGQTYYWRARAADGANTGPYSSVSHFSMVEPVKIEAPTPIELCVGTVRRELTELRMAMEIAAADCFGKPRVVIDTQHEVRIGHKQPAFFLEPICEPQRRRIGLTAQH